MKSKLLHEGRISSLLSDHYFSDRGRDFPC